MIREGLAVLDRDGHKDHERHIRSVLDPQSKLIWDGATFGAIVAFRDYPERCSYGSVFVRSSPAGVTLSVTGGGIPAECYDLQVLPVVENQAVQVSGATELGKVTVSLSVPEWGTVTISNDKIRFAVTTQAYDAWWHRYRKRKWGKGLSVRAVRFGREQSVR